MDLFRSVQAVADSGGDGIVDWDAVGAAAKAATPRGDLDLSAEEQTGYRNDVRDARDRLRSVGDVEFDLPDTVEIQDRHHWIDANIATFRRVIEPLGDQTTVFPGVSRAVNTGTMAVTLGFLGRNVLGQYDPLLLADTDDHSLYFVRPNILRVADQLGVDYPRFRRWIAFHEVAHAAEFGAAPWLPGYLEDRMQAAVSDLTEGHLNRSAYNELNTTMTAVEGYAELLMDQAFDDEYADLRAKLDARRQGGGPFVQVMRRLLGLGLKRQQYEQGAAFFEAIAEARDIAAASAVWEQPENLPTSEEIETPGLWLQRVER